MRIQTAFGQIGLLPGRVKPPVSMAIPHGPLFGTDETPKDETPKGVSKETESNPPAKPVKPPDRLQKWISRWLLVAPLTGFLGGASLLASSAMPGEGINKPALLESALAATQKKEKVSAPPQVSNPEEEPFLDEADMLRLKEILASVGLYLGGVGLFTGCVSGVFIGYREKQPSMLVSSLWGMAVAPLVAIDPSLAMKATYLLSSVFFLPGLANKMNNAYHLKPGQKPREYDMQGLLNPRGVKHDPADPRNSITRIWTEEAFRTLKFFGEDQVLVMVASKDLLKKALDNPAELKEKLTLAIKQTREYCKKSSDPTVQKELPDFLKPTAEQNQAGAALMYLGVIPMIFLGDNSIVTALAPIPVSLGGAVAGSALFATGLNQKDLVGKSLLAAFPTMLAGNMYVNTNAGMGAILMGNAVTNNYFRSEYLRLQKEVDEAEPANDNEPPTPTTAGDPDTVEK